MSDSRADFEAWWSIDSRTEINKWRLALNSDGEYIHPMTHSCWAAWQAARASQWREILGSDGAYTGDEILAWGDKLGIKQVYYSDKDHLAHPWCIDDTGVRYVFGAFTKWQPLPQPPVSK